MLVIWRVALISQHGVISAIGNGDYIHRTPNPNGAATSSSGVCSAGRTVASPPRRLSASPDSDQLGLDEPNVIRLVALRKGIRVVHMDQKVKACRCRRKRTTDHNICRGTCG